MCVVWYSENVLIFNFAGSLETLQKERTTSSDQFVSQNISKKRIGLDDGIASLKLCLNSLEEPNDKDDSLESEKITGKNWPASFPFFYC